MLHPVPCVPCWHSPTQVIFVAATKADIPTRRVPEKEGRDWAANQGFPYFEVRRIPTQTSMGAAGHPLHPAPAIVMYDMSEPRWPTKGPPPTLHRVATSWHKPESAAAGRLPLHTRPRPVHSLPALQHALALAHHAGVGEQREWREGSLCQPVCAHAGHDTRHARGAHLIVGAAGQPGPGGRVTSRRPEGGGVHEDSLPSACRLFMLFSQAHAAVTPVRRCTTSSLIPPRRSPPPRCTYIYNRHYLRTPWQANPTL